ncbi:MAG: pyruvate kinase [Porphyromonas sp.]|nr:pyruvate kinase [Porphyromonas sp.]
MHLYKSTKIVATISDKRCDVPFLEQVIHEGVDVVRMNSAHLDHDGFDKIIGNVKKVSPNVAILMDTKGPEVRTTGIDRPTILTTGSKLEIIADSSVISTPERISVNSSTFVSDVPVGASILIDDGLIELKVLSKDEARLYCEVMNEGELGARKSVNVPGVSINQPALSEKDIDSIHYSINHEVDFIAHSFVRTKEDVLAIQKILDENKSDIKIISKIENQQGVDNIDEIIDASYGIMVARGDLGIEIDLEKIPAIQQTIIHKCILKKKPVIIATQMLHTMIHSPRPTRAEVSDVAGAIFMHTDAVMLSGETAYGRYPVESVRTMAEIIHEAEQTKITIGRSKLKPSENDIEDVTSYLAKQTVKATDKLGLKAIINDSYSGATARNLSAYRGTAPIFAVCYKKEVARQLALSYGVRPFYLELEKETKRPKRWFYIKALEYLLEKGLLEKQDMIAYIGGTLFFELGTTTMDLMRVKDALDFYEEEEGYLSD